PPGLSITFLALAPQLAAREMLGDVALGFDVILAMVCLVLYAMLMHVLLRAVPEEGITPHR
ncbi:MAG: hypothetical protein ABIZ91_11425, partial [Gemmatimonadaceae bacterium]